MAKQKVKGSHRKEMSQAFHEKSEQEMNALRASVAGTLKNDMLRLLDEELHTDLVLTNGVHVVRAHKSIFQCRQLYTVSDAVLLLEEFVPFLPGFESAQEPLNKMKAETEKLNSDSFAEGQSEMNNPINTNDTIVHLAPEAESLFDDDCKCQLEQTKDIQLKQTCAGLSGNAAFNSCCEDQSVIKPEPEIIKHNRENGQTNGMYNAKHELEGHCRADEAHDKSFNEKYEGADNFSTCKDLLMCEKCVKVENEDLCASNQDCAESEKFNSVDSKDVGSELSEVSNESCTNDQCVTARECVLKSGKDLGENGKVCTTDISSEGNKPGCPGPSDCLTTPGMTSAIESEPQVIGNRSIQTSLEKEKTSPRFNCIESDQPQESISLQESHSSNLSSSDSKDKNSTFLSLDIPHETCSPVGKDLLLLYFNQLNADCCLAVNGEQFPAHKSVLSARCEYFEAMLGGQWSESHSEVVTLEGVSARAVDKLLLFLYGGVLTFPGEDISRDLVDLFLVADMYGVSSLSKVLSFYVRQDLCHFFHKPCQACTLTAADAFSLSHNFNLDELKQRCLKWIGKNFPRVWPSKSFAGLPDVLHQCSLKWITGQFTPSNVLDIISECSRLTSSLPRVKWTEGVLCLLTQLMDAAIEFTSSNFVRVIQTPEFLQWAQGAVWKASALEEIFTPVIDSLPVDKACHVFQALLKLQASRAVELEQISQDKSSPPNDDVAELLEAMVRRCERFLRTHIHQVMRSSQWSELPKPVQARIMETSAYLSLSDLPDPKPRPGGARKPIVTPRPVLQARPAPETRRVRARGSSVAGAAASTVRQGVARGAGALPGRPSSQATHATEVRTRITLGPRSSTSRPTGQSQRENQPPRAPRVNRGGDAQRTNTGAAAARPRPETDKFLPSQRTLNHKGHSGRENQNSGPMNRSKTAVQEKQTQEEQQAEDLTQSRSVEHEEESEERVSHSPSENSHVQCNNNAVLIEGKCAHLEPKIDIDHEAVEASSCSAQDPSSDSEISFEKDSTIQDISHNVRETDESHLASRQRENVSPSANGTSLSTATSNDLGTNQNSCESSPAFCASRPPGVSRSSMSRSPQQRWSSGSPEPAENDLEHDSTPVYGSPPSAQSQEADTPGANRPRSQRDKQETGLECSVSAGDMPPSEVKVIKMSRPLSVGFVIPPN